MPDPDLLASFRRVVEEAAPSLFRLAARITGSSEDAEDVVQESLMKAWDAIQGSRFEGRSQVKTWLYRIVANAATDALRTRKRRKRLAEEGHGEAVVSGEPIEARAALRELAEWLDHLPADQRTAIVLKEIEGCTSAEIGLILGCSEGAVEQRLVRARAALRQRSEHD